MFASSTGQPFNSGFLNLGNFKRFLLDKNAKVATKAKMERISIKLIIKV
jgi:hypothetical protein